MARWQGIAKGAGLFILGVMIGGASHGSAPQSSNAPTPSVKSTVLSANDKADAVSPSPSVTPSPTPTPTPVVTPTPKPATPKPVVAAASNCDPNYSGGCVPIASDVDCAGGSGNGPAYVRGPVKVIGADIYKLDTDHDGYGCE